MAMSRKNGLRDLRLARETCLPDRQACVPPAACSRCSPPTASPLVHGLQVPTCRDGTQGGGFTLVEAVISVLIVAVMLVVALDTLGAVGRARTVQGKPGTARALGWALVTEIFQGRYEDPNEPGQWGLETGEGAATRADFNDSDDYDGWSASPPQSKDGTPMTHYQGWTRRARITLIDPRALTVSLVGDLGLRMIVVEVTDPDGNATDVRALRSKYGAGQKEPAYETTFVTWTGIDLQVGPDATRRIDSGVNLVNPAKAEAGS